MSESLGRAALSADEQLMGRALDLAVQGPRGVNPQVGCVIVDASGIVAEGFHHGAGTAHAEVEALARAGERARGATAYVTLEPCAHTGRTGPCVDALIAAGVGRVVYALDDPTEQAHGGGQALRAAGIDVIDGVLASESAALLHDWLHVRATGRPFVALKMATSLDGRVDDQHRAGRRLTGEDSRTYVQALRAGSDAVMVGTGTVLADDPRLTVRGGDVQPWRIVVGSRSIPAHASIRGTDGRFLQFDSGSPAQILGELAELGVARVLLEGGPRLAASCLREGLVDEVHWFTAPVLLGEGPMAFADQGPALGLDVRSVRVIGEDVCFVGTPIAHLQQTQG